MKRFGETVCQYKRLDKGTELHLVERSCPKFDVRDWAPGHEKMGKGITFNREEAEALYVLLGKVLRK